MADLTDSVGLYYAKMAIYHVSLSLLRAGTVELQIFFLMIRGDPRFGRHFYAERTYYVSMYRVIDDLSNN